MTSIPRTPILGVGISAVNLQTATNIAMEWIAARQKHYVTVTGVHGLIEAQDNPQFKALLNRSGMSVPDGMPLVWLLKLAGQTHVTQVCGYDFTLALSEAMAAAGKSAFYYGGGPGIAEDLADRLARRFPGLRTAGTHTPPFRQLTPDEETQIVERINNSGADVVWVGLSTPKQEQWMVGVQSRISAPLLIGVGAVFDFLTGRTKRAPRWMQRSGLEWLFRLNQEPVRLWRRYLRNNPLFMYYLACEKLGIRDFNRTS